MHCWKTINLEQKYGDYYIIAASLLTMILSFIFLYLPLSFVFNIDNVKSGSLWIFLFILITIYPVHNAIHIVFIFLLRVKFTIQVRKRTIFLFFPIYIYEPIAKWKYVTCLLMPFLFINSLILFALFQFPSYFHYITFILSFHLGICVSDFIYLKWLRKSPKNCFIEETDEGYQILTVSHSEES